MKRNIYNKVSWIVKGVLPLYLFTFLLLSCDDYLDTDNEKVVPAHNELNSLGALQSTTANLYTSPWYFFHKQRMMQLGDARANNMHSSADASNAINAQVSFSEVNDNAAIAHAWGSLYNVITQAAYIIDDYAPYCVEQEICTQDEANVCVAEARFMRALAYWFLSVYWHDVPIVENAVTTSTVAYANKFEDVLQYAICEAEFARTWLPTTPYQTGRVTKVSAQALLSRLYLTAGAFAKGGHYSADFQIQVLDKYYADDTDYQGKSSLAAFYYTKAANAAQAAIDGAAASGYGLMDDYEQIFRVQNNNCKEVLFALQFVQGNIQTGLGNDLQGSPWTYDVCIDNNYGQSWSTWASYDFINLSSMRGGLSRTRGNVFLRNMTYDYLFHEWEKCPHGKHGQTWTVERNNNSVMPIKKQVVGGPMATDNMAFKGNSAFNTPMIRMSEVYLNLTEALMGLNGLTETTDPDILSGVNIVRRRAFAKEIANDTYPGDYGVTGVFNLDSLLQERRMEFYMEGLSWADIVRRSFMGDDHLKRMVDYNNNDLYDMEGDPAMGCHRLHNYGYVAAATTDKIGTVTLKQKDGGYDIARPSHRCVHNIAEGSYCHSSAVADADNLWSMIYPPTETTQDPNLLQAPVSFDFTQIINKKSYYNE